MIVSRFLLWARQAPTGHRAEAVAALANAFLYSDLSPDDRAEAEIGLTAMLDDPAPAVRAAMAEALAGSPDAPRHVMVALTSDTADIAAVVLARSPVLSDADLVDAAALGGGRLQRIIAERPGLSAAVAAALAEVGEADALVALARNATATVAEFSLARMVERHGSDALLREALLVRPGLPVELAQAIAASLAAELGRFVTGCGWLSAERSGRITGEARDRATVALARPADRDGAERLAAHLRRTGQLTPGLMLRALLSGRTTLAAAAFADLAALPADRVEAILDDKRSAAAFRALYGRAGLPPALQPAFEAALEACREAGTAATAEAVGLSRPLVARVLGACEALPGHEAGRLVSFLRRFEVEAALDHARGAAFDLAEEAAAFVAARCVPALPSVRPDDRLAA